MASKKKIIGPSTYTFLIPEHVVRRWINVVDGQPLRVLTSRGNKQSDFSSFKITTGDTIVPVHIVKGRICPIAKMTIAFKGAAHDWNIDRPTEEWLPVHPSTPILVGNDGTPMHFNRPLPIEIVRALRYDAAKGPRELKLHDDGRLAQHMGIDGVFRLVPESADELLSLSWI